MHEGATYDLAVGLAIDTIVGPFNLAPDEFLGRVKAHLAASETEF
jgi:hypothetical protein